MSPKRFLPMLIVSLAIPAALPHQAVADLRLRLYVQSDSAKFMGREIPAASDTNTVWMSGDKACWHLGDTASFVLHSEDGMLYMLDHAAKQYSQLPLGEIFGADNPELQQMMAMMKMEVTVTPTDETKKIGDWDCRKYVTTKKMPMAVSTSESWATEDVELDSEAYSRIMTSTMAYFPNYLEIVEQYKKISGVIVKETTTVEVMGQQIKSSTELIDVSEEEAPVGVYSVPEDYKLVEPQPPGLH